MIQIRYIGFFCLLCLINIFVWFWEIHDNLVMSAEEERRLWGRTYSNKLLCMIPAQLDHIGQKRIERIIKTYGNFCDFGPLFFVEKFQEILPDLVKLNPRILIFPTTNITNYNKWILWKRNKKMLTFAFTKFYKQADWIARVDDDSFFSPVSAKNILKFYSPNVAHFLGLPMYNVQDLVFNSGAAIILSKKALKKIVLGFDGEMCKKCECDKRGGGDDIRLAKCLSFFNIYPEKTLDKNGLHYFGAFFSDEKNFTVKFPNFYNYNRSVHSQTFFNGRPKADNKGCCSKYLMAYHRPYKNCSVEENKEWNDLHSIFNVNFVEDRSNLPNIPEIISKGT